MKMEENYVKSFACSMFTFKIKNSISVNITIYVTFGLCNMHIGLRHTCDTEGIKLTLYLNL